MFISSVEILEEDEWFYMLGYIHQCEGIKPLTLFECDTMNSYWYGFQAYMTGYNEAHEREWFHMLGYIDRGDWYGYQAYLNGYTGPAEIEKKKNVIEITKATIVTGTHTDCIVLDTVLPNGMWPYTGNATVKLNIAMGAGEKYIKKHFPDLPIEVISVKYD